MGRPFSDELSRLEETYAWALEQDIAAITAFFRSAADRPLVAVGSGGSLSAAAYATYLHQQATGWPSRALTPMQFIGQRTLRETAALFLSAAGKNHDILAAIRAATSLNDFRHFGSMSLRTKSPLSVFATRFLADLFSAEPPAGGDGFLASNSLVAFFTLLLRAHLTALPNAGALPGTYRALTAHARFSLSEFEPVLAREHVIVLYDSTTYCAALDLESKFSEAALAAIQLADFRNFAHGRHNWVAKHQESTSVLAIYGHDTSSVAEATLDLLRDRIPIATVGCSGPGAIHSFAALRAVYDATLIAGKLRGIDPGRPRVPTFGRRIYHLRGFAPVPRVKRTVSLSLAAQRKVGSAWGGLDPSSQSKLTSAARSYLDSLQHSPFASVVFDFDGTLCSTRQRAGPLSAPIVKELERILHRGLIIGIATGRGRSVREQVQQSLSREYWQNLWIGYYNGADIGRLSDDGHPSILGRVAPELQGAEDLLRRDETIKTLAKVTCRPSQITIEPIVYVGLQELYGHVQAVASRYLNDTKVLLSSHSIDIVPAATSKVAVVRHISRVVKPTLPILCIGDSGRYPGNDHELLREPFSLSSDEVSTDLSSCWNFAPASHTGVSATLFYLRHLAIGRNAGTLRFRVDDYTHE